mmetsp:Transcript_36317/g.82799  ORF Transcript_36317/g.82799 Transcript_36317/m.82799 type:complete len:392 (+) Transcript_36317:879-2054(+)
MRDSTPCRAWSKDSRTPPSAALTLVTRSLTSGSTLGLCSVSLVSAAAARVRTRRVLSLRHLTKVVWSCGRKGLRDTPPLSKSTVSVCTIAALTCQMRRSPRTRMQGPVIVGTNGFIASEAVNSTISPNPAAACSRISGVPWIKPCKKIGKSGARPLGRQKPGMTISITPGSFSRRSWAEALSCWRMGSMSSVCSSLGTTLTTLSSEARAAVCTSSSGSARSPTRVWMITAIEASSGHFVRLTKMPIRVAKAARVSAGRSGATPLYSSDSSVGTPSADTASTTRSVAAWMPGVSGPVMPSLSADRMAGSRQVSASPHTSARAASARAWKRVIGSSVRRGTRKGSTAEERTESSWRRPSRAAGVVSDSPSLPSSSATSSEGTTSSTALGPMFL